jgi:predicted NBD/HSP70 family sugar kinase
VSNGSPSALRILNDQAALNYLADTDVVSRLDLEVSTGLSKPAAGELLLRLETAGLVEKAGLRTGNRGPGAQLWRLRPDAGYAAAVNVTPTGMQLQISDLRGKALATLQSPLSDGEAADQVESLLTHAIRNAGIAAEDVRCLVVGVPGAVDPRTGVVKYAPHLPGWQGYDLGSRIQERTGVETEVENDVNLMAISEMSRRARDFNNYALVWIDEGAGAALVIDGQIFRGFSGGAGEIDYVRVSSQRDTSCTRDRFGAKWGDLLGSPAIHELAESCGLHGVETAEQLAEAIDFSAPAIAFLTEFGAEIAAGLTAIVTVLDPELIMLSGAYGSVGGERLADIVSAQLAELVPSSEDNRTRIRCLPLPADAALLGAAQVALARSREIVFQWGSVGASPVVAARRPLAGSDRPRP